LERFAENGGWDAVWEEMDNHHAVNPYAS